MWVLDWLKEKSLESAFGGDVTRGRRRKSKRLTLRALAELAGVEVEEAKSDAEGDSDNYDSDGEGASDSKTGGGNPEVDGEVPVPEEHIEGSMV